MCQENIAYTTEQNKSQEKLYNIISATTPDIQNTIRELASGMLQDALPDECLGSWVKKRKLVTLDVDAQQFKKRRGEETGTSLIATKRKVDDKMTHSDKHGQL